MMNGTVSFRTIAINGAGWLSTRDRRVRRQSDGEEVDIEAAIESLVERQAQTAPTEDVYIRRDRRRRDVAVAFLVDLSGSTGRHLGLEGKRIIDVEKEGLVLLAEAL